MPTNTRFLTTLATTSIVRNGWLAFNKHEEQIRKACEGLVKVKRYSMAAEESDKDIEALVCQRWFMERVFDKYLWFNAAGG